MPDVVLGKYYFVIWEGTTAFDKSRPWALIKYGSETAWYFASKEEAVSLMLAADEADEVAQ